MTTFDKVLWSIVFSVLIATCGFNIMENRKLRSQLNNPSADGESALLKAQSYALSQSGKIIRWPEGLKVLGDESDPVEGYGLVLAVDDLSCDVCRDEQTQFLLELERATPDPVTRIVVSSDNILYARGYMRMNAVPGSVFYDQEKRFFKENLLATGPLLLLHNPQGEVIAAHFPIPGRPETSVPFHNMVRSFFGVNQVSRETPLKEVVIN